MKRINDKVFFSIFVLLASVCVYLQPMVCDDYMYCFYHRTSNRIHSIGEAIGSANSYYMNWNGRYFPNLFDHISLCLLPHWTIILISAFVIGLTLYLMHKLAIRRISMTILALAYWIFLPDKTECLYMTTCFYNYAVPGACCLGVLFLYQSINERKTLWSVFIIAYAIFAALQHEAISLPLSGAFFFTLLSNRNWKKTSHSQWYIIVGFWIGTLLCTFAPGTFVRVGGAADSVPKNLTFYLSAAMSFLLSLCQTWLWLFILFIRRKKMNLKEYFFKNEIIILSILFGILLFVALSVVTEVPDSRYFYFIHLFSLILLMELLSEIEWINRKFSVVIFGVLAFVAITVSIYQQYNKQNIVSKELAIIKNSTDFVVPVDELYLSSDPTCHANVHTSNYLGKEKIIAYPSALYYNVYLDDCKEKDEVINGWLKYGDQYVIPWLRNEIPDVEWSKVIGFPIISGKEFITHPTVNLFYSKSGKRYLLLTNSKHLTKVTKISIKD